MVDLDSVMTTIKVDKNEKEIEDIRRSCEWRAGLWKVQNEMVGQMESLVCRGRKKQKRVQEKIQRMQNEKADNTLQPEILLEEDDTPEANLEEGKRRKRTEKGRCKACVVIALASNIIVL